MLRHDGGAAFEVHSAGTRASFVRPEAIQAMREIGIDISQHRSKSVVEFAGRQFDYVITVCAHANQVCPVFPGQTRRIHQSFEDPPAPDVGDDEFRLRIFRRVRDELRAWLRDFAAAAQKEMSIEPMTAADWPTVAHIYQLGIDTENATFTDAPPPSWDDWCKGKLNHCSLVARAGEGTVLGWAALSPVSTRAVYAGVAEVSIYIDPAAQGRGVGEALMRALIERSEAAGLWTLQASIFPENEASLRLHYKHGFRQVGVREKIGQMSYGKRAGEWRDTVFVERRSLKVNG